MFDMSICYRHGYGARIEIESAAKLLAHAAELGHTKAMVELGLCAWFGEGMAQDDQVALKWWKQAAAEGSAVAQYSLGVMHELGRAVQRQDQRAVEHYCAAAEQGYHPALQALQDLGVADMSQGILAGKKAAQELGDALGSERQLPAFQSVV
eukprot:TRINITY_DN2624_c0_g1_i6.p1 TRINITY_DN2624_c0_g1~~TRINITY_DN2624_c0_g1_i6.p1  ORF type:complete len:152 (-),score=23.27 TRINITY_DN2624_c0_g1_i6:83-538(-)